MTPSLTIREGYVLVYRLYDVANEIDLLAAERLFSRNYPTGRMQLSRVRPKAIHFSNPPVTLRVSPDELPAHAWFLHPTNILVRLYDFGVISVRLDIPLPSGASQEEVIRLFTRVLNEGPETSCRHVALQAMQQCSSALYKPQWDADAWEDEDYAILYVRHFQQQVTASQVLHAWDIPRVLMGETTRVSQQVSETVLAHTYTYSPEDLAVVSWEAAFVYDVDGVMDVPDLLEFANAQLLELSFFDDRLDDALEGAYDDVEDVHRRGGLFKYRRLRDVSSRLLMTVVDVTELSGRVMNALKVTEDVFYAMVYSGAAEVLGLPTWMESVENKIDTLRSIYSMLADEAADVRMTLIEVAILLLILFEIVLALLGRW